MGILRGLFTALLAILLAVIVTTSLLVLSFSEQQIRSTEIDEARCPAPDGWGAHVVQVGENLTVLAEIVGRIPAELVIANCLKGDVHPGDTVFLPPPLLEGDFCGPPPDWQLYEIQAGDTLTSLAQRYGVDEESLWHANCMSESMTFPPRFRLYVPSTSETR